jgi:hypothetical protein
MYKDEPFRAVHELDVLDDRILSLRHGQQNGADKATIPGAIKGTRFSVIRVK